MKSVLRSMDQDDLDTKIEHTAASLPDPDRVLALMRQVANEEIMPRFGRLAAGDIRSKRTPWDVVTVADEAAERTLIRELQTILPESTVIGEEGVDTNPELLSGLNGSAPVWLVDPLDGTRNFAAGVACFAVIIALVRDQQILCGWILDPISNVAVWATVGGGAWKKDQHGLQQLSLGCRRTFSTMHGSLTSRATQHMRRRAAERDVTMPEGIVRLGCVGREYADLARGALDFACYKRLKPWDHAAGVLIHREAGGFSAVRGSAAPDPYRPHAEIVDETLILAPDAATWQILDTLLD